MLVNAYRVHRSVRVVRAKQENTNMNIRNQRIERAKLCVINQLSCFESGKWQQK